MKKGEPKIALERARSTADVDDPISLSSLQGKGRKRRRRRRWRPFCERSKQRPEEWLGPEEKAGSLDKAWARPGRGLPLIKESLTHRRQT